MSLKYKPGDKVFAKVRGYPYWPARIEASADETPNKNKYHVYFYGTAETAICKAEEVVPYLENRDKYGKPLKRKGFNEGLQLLQLELNGALPEPVIVKEELDGEPSEPLDEAAIAAAAEERRKRLLNAIKRKRESRESGGGEDLESKRKYARLSAGANGAPNGPSRSSTDASGDSPLKPKVVSSRSGRKIKPKKFADDDGGSSFADSFGESGTPGDSEPYKARKSQGTPISFDYGVPSPGEQVPENDADSAEGIPHENPNRVLLARSLSGHYVQIRLDDNRPKSFVSEEKRLLWDAATARNAKRLKGQIEMGEYLPESIRKQLEANKPNLSEAQKKQVKKDSCLQRKRGKLRWLQVEARLLELDNRIKLCLGLERADPDLCLTYMDQVIEMNIDPLMLKKHPAVVSTASKLQHYVGNTSRWDMTPEEEADFNAKCERLRMKAKFMYHKFKKLFTIPVDKKFWDVFDSEVKKFNKAVEDMPKDKVYSLVVDPEVLSSVSSSEDENELLQSKKEEMENITDSVKSPQPPLAEDEAQVPPTTEAAP